MDVRRLVSIFGEILFSPKIILHIIRWPKFSFSSYKLLKSLKARGVSPSVIIDLGANVGQFSIAALHLFPGTRVWCFEPNPTALRQLQKNIRSCNGISTSSIAIGDARGKAVLNINSHSHSSSLLKLGSTHVENFPAAREIDAVTVQVDRLDNVFGAEDLLGQTVLLKIDVQGFERPAILGASGILHLIDFVVLETSFKPLYKDEAVFNEVLDLMKEKGFKFCGPVGFLESEKTGEILQMDALFRRITEV